MFPPDGWSRQAAAPQLNQKVPAGAAQGLFYRKLPGAESTGRVAQVQPRLEVGLHTLITAGARHDVRHQSPCPSAILLSGFAGILA